MSSIIKKTIVAILSVSLMSFLLVISILWTYSNQLPDYKFLKNYKPPVSSKLYSGSGELVNDYSTEKRLLVDKLRNILFPCLKENSPLNIFENQDKLAEMNDLLEFSVSLLMHVDEPEFKKQWIQLGCR